jgi:hypothetical protein
MSGTNWQKTISSVLSTAFQGKSFQYKEDAVDMSEMVSADGLLPILVEQAQMTARVVGSIMGGLDGVSVVASPDAKMGKKVVFTDTAPVCLVLPFILDAVDAAYKLTRKNNPGEENIIRLENIIPPVPPEEMAKILQINPQDGNVAGEVEAETPITPE